MFLSPITEAENRNNVINPSQHGFRGFREHHNTATAAIDLLNHVIQQKS